MNTANAEFESGLISQKNYLLEEVDYACNAKQLAGVAAILDFADIMWSRVNYGYKTREVRERIVRRADTLISTAEEQRDTYKKNRREYRQWQAEIHMLNQVRKEQK